MPFFIRKPTKRKIQKEKKGSKKIKKKEVKPKPASEKVVESDIESETDDDDEGFTNRVQSSDDDDEDKYLTAQEKKVKLAKQFLEQVEKREREKQEIEDEVLGNHILQTLKTTELEKAGKLKRKLADHIKLDLDNVKVLFCKQHKLSITCVTISSDSRFLYSASKDYSIVKWSLESFSKTEFKVFKVNSTGSGVKSTNNSHKSVINCLTISFDNKFLVSGDEKGKLIVWNPNTLEHVHTFKAHKDSVTDVAVCRDTNFLYSSSKDSLVKAWNLNEKGYMETLFGHQSGVTSVDIVNDNRVITSGGSDKSVRLWKIQEESQLVFNVVDGGSVDIVRKLDENYFVSAGDDGKICLWTVFKRKPLYVVEAAHGVGAENGQPNWISALAVLPNSDLIASGSCDGYIRLWKWHQDKKTIIPMKTVSKIGFVNCIQFTPNGSYLVAGSGKEHRWGRWQCIKEAKNNITCIPISKINGL